MKYELKNERDKNLSLLLQVLKNRGIQEIEHYLTVDDNDILEPTLFPSVEQGAKIYKKHAENNSKTFLLVDADADGYTSSAIIYNYTRRLYPEWVDENWKYFLHDGKQHGLNDCIKYILSNDFKFVIIPDAGSNDHDEIKMLVDAGMDVLIMDHHEADKVDENAIVINNQLCDYPTKSLSGAGIVYKFCQYLDTYLEKDIADDFLDLAAIGMVSDMMDLRDFETHRLVEKGLNNIKNPFVLGIVEKNDFSLKGRLNPHGVSFCISPVVNAVTRVGTLDEKDLLFQAFLENHAYKEIPGNKRGHKGEMTPLVDEAIRVAGNVRSRQNKVRDSKFEKVVDLIESGHLTDNKIIAVCQNEITDDERGITGLIANQTMAKYKRPVLILSPVKHDDGLLYWDGSGRNAPNCGLNDLRSFLASTKQVAMAQGHASAFGISIPQDQFDDFIASTNEALADYDFSTTYQVDAIYSTVDLEASDIISIYKAGDLWTQGIEEPIIAVKDIKVNKDNVFINEKVLKITNPNGISFVKFKPTSEELMLFSTLKDSYTIDVVGTCNYSSFDDTAQIMITDYNLIKNTFWDF